ncbi:MAG: hypothetical protein KGD57_08005 [Candidatus Lokiarchaeota archaeon]|nr:hypothetical protein [Candidatus Lokiarchaeota archaeon]
MINIPDIIKVQGKIRGYANLKKTAIYVKDDHEQIYSCYTSKKINLGMPSDNVIIIGEELNNNKIRINYIENITLNLTHNLIYKKINKSISISLILVLFLITLYIITTVGSDNWFETYSMKVIFTLLIYMFIYLTIPLLVAFMIATILKKRQKRRYIENMINLQVDRNVLQIDNNQKESKENKKINYCSNCVHQVTSKAKYCSSCGNKI